MQSRWSSRGWMAAALVGILAAAGAGASDAALQSAQFDVVALEQGQGGQVTIRFKVWIKGKKSRVEVSNPLAGDFQIIADGKTLYQVVPAQKQAWRSDQAQATGGRDAWQMFVANAQQLRQGARKTGSETIEGHLCDVFVRSESKDGRSASVRAWITRSLQPPMPLKVIRQMKIQRPGASMSQTSTVRVRNLKLNAPVADRLFTLPAGYKVVDGPTGMPGPGGMAPGMGMPGGGPPRGLR